jgi:outer membrane protein
MKYMLKRFSLILAIGAVTAIPAFSQNIYNYSLQDCINYALKNQPSVKSARIDELSTVAEEKQVTGMALPQVSGTGQFQDNIVVQKQLIDGSYFDPSIPKGTLIPIAFGIQYNLSGAVNVNQTIFDGSVLVALQAKKTVLELSQKQIASTEQDVKVAVSKAYYNVLLSEKEQQLINDNVNRLQKLLRDTKIMYQNGVAEKLDIDKLDVQLNNLLTQQTQAENGITLSNLLLKYQMGMPLKDSVTLTDTLNLDDVKTALLNTANQFDYSQRIEFQLAELQKKEDEYNLKRYKLASAPTLSAFGSIGASRQSEQFDYFSFNKFWYGYGYVGLNLNVPIFSGFQKKYQVVQAKLAVDKSQVQIDALKQSIDLEQQQARTNLSNNLITIASQEKNMQLAEEVYNQTVKKYEEGVGSTTEINNAEGDLQQAQLNYYNALYSAMLAKIDYLKAYGQLK